MARTRYRTFRHTSRRYNGTPAQQARCLWRGRNLWAGYDTPGSADVATPQDDAPPLPAPSVAHDAANPYTPPSAERHLMTMTTAAHALYDHPQFAAALVGVRAVTLLGDGTASVASQTDPAKAYQVNGHCECKDAQYQAPEGWCKHRLATALVTRVRQALQRGVDEANHCRSSSMARGRPARRCMRPARGIPWWRQCTPWRHRKGRRCRRRPRASTCVWCCTDARCN